MAEATHISIIASLEELGFKGKVLNDIGVLVRSEAELEEFETFIMNNEETLTTNLSILNSYRKIKIEQEKMSKSEFITYYSGAPSTQQKQQCLELLLKSYIENKWVFDLDNKVHSGDTTLGDFYKAFEDNPNLHVKKLLIEAVCITQGIDW